MRPVSIHAPVWVRRNRVRGRVDGQVVSIHAPVWVRPRQNTRTGTDKRFQFTHPCGCDLRRRGGRHDHGSFNSRTRVGATLFGFHMIPCLCVSIHAPVWVRHLFPCSCSPSLKFQFTHPCGCDPLISHYEGDDNGFNSRTRVGATRRSRGRIRDGRVSIHAPVWVRPGSISKIIPTCWFQFTHPCGCDWVLCECGFITNPVSIHAPVWVRHPFCSSSQGHLCFNSRTRVGATVGAVHGDQIHRVSIHAPVWVRPDPAE